jgi:hypothetical protein
MLIQLDSTKLAGNQEFGWGRFEHFLLNYSYVGTVYKNFTTKWKYRFLFYFAYKCQWSYKSISFKVDICDNTVEDIVCWLVTLHTLDNNSGTKVDG